jgi:hypothetical protein
MTDRSAAARRLLGELGGLVLLRALVDLGYIAFVTANYSHMGFSLVPVLPRIVESYGLLLVAGLAMPRSNPDGIPSAAVRILMIFVFVPLLSYYALGGGRAAYLYASLGGYLLTVAALGLLPRLRIGRQRGPKLQGLLTAGLAAVSLMLMVYLVVTRGVPSLRALTLGPAIYEIRGASDWSRGLLAYLIPWQARVFNSYLVTVAWARRRWIGVGFAGLLVLVTFLFTAHRSYLLTPLFALAMLFGLRRAAITRFLIGASVAVVGAALLLHGIGLSDGPASLVVRRTLFVPAQITSQYFEFFSENPKTYLSQSRLGSLLGEGNPYDAFESIPYMMGAIYADNPENHRNTGYLGSAFMNFGWVGIAVVSLSLAFLLVLMEAVARDAIDRALLLALFMSVLNSALLTSMSTHGIALGILLVWLRGSGCRMRTSVAAGGGAASAGANRVPLCG